jgi:hypothetical protein
MFADKIDWTFANGEVRNLSETVLKCQDPVR